MAAPKIRPPKIFLNPKRKIVIEEEPPKPKTTITVSLLKKEQQIEKIKEWITNPNLQDFLIEKLGKDLSENKLKELIGKQIKCRDFIPGFNELSGEKCGIINLPYETNNIVIRNSNDKNFIVSIIELVKGETEYDRKGEFIKVIDFLTKSMINRKVLEDLTKTKKLVKIDMSELQKVIDLLNKFYENNIMIFLNKFFGETGIVSSIAEAQPLIGLCINNDTLETLSFFNTKTGENEIFTNDTIFQNIIKENSIKIKKVEEIEDEEEEKEEKKETIIRKPNVSISIKPKKREVEDLIVDPEDIGALLDVVKLTLDKKYYELLKGKTGNLYTRTIDNVLVGKVVDGELYLIENFKSYF